MMDRDNLRFAFPDQSPKDYHEALLHTLGHLPQPPKARRVSRRALLIAAILLVLALAIVAVANKDLLSSQALQVSLNNEIQVPKAVESGLVKNAASCQKEGVTLSIDEYVLDGGGMRVMWSVTSQRDTPVFYVNSPSRADLPPFTGETVTMDIGDCTLVMLGAQVGRVKVPQSNLSYMELTWGPEKPVKPFPFTVTVYVFETDMNPVLVDEPGDGYAPNAEISPQEMQERNLIPVSQYGYANLSLNTKFREAYNRLLAEAGITDDTVPEADKIYHHDAFVEAGLMKPLTTLTATFTVDPSQMDMRPLSAYKGPEAFELGDCTVVIDNFDCYTMNLDYDIRIYPKEPAVEPSYSDYGLLMCDDQFNSLAIRPGADWKVDDQGRIYYQYYGEYPPNRIPDTIYLMISKDIILLKNYMPETIKNLMEDDPDHKIVLPMALREDMKQ